MKKLIYVMWFFVSAPAWSQQADLLIFREKTFDFGEIEESAGAADHEFSFTNNSGRPIKILSVQASCGCTTPGWSKDVIPQGKLGFIKASFDPKGRPGYFNKTLTVNTDLDPNPIVLQIKGQVTTKDALEANDFPVAFGNLYLKTKSFNMGTVYLNKVAAARQFPIMNKGTKAVKLISVAKPPYIKVDMPLVLGPQAKGFIKITYDAKLKNVFGFSTDNVLITTDDEGSEMKSISVYASLEEYYAIPTGDEAMKSPRLFFAEQNVDLGRFNQSEVIERNVFARNIGKRDIQLKAIQPNCACVTAAAERLTIRPGDSTAIKIQFRPQSRGGTQQKAITVYSNDPRNPVQRILIQAYIED